LRLCTCEARVPAEKRATKSWSWAIFFCFSAFSDSIRERTKRSPDDFDAMMLAFVDTKDYFAETYAQVMSVG
jgi:hypothetical protein